MSHQQTPRAQPSWIGWGDPEQAITLPREVLQLIVQALGIRDDRPRGAPPARTALEARLPSQRLPAEVIAELAKMVGPEHASAEPGDRLSHLRGKSTTDLLRLRDGDLSGAPDLVVRPGSHDDTVALLRACSRRRVAVVPFGGGTSVVGGLEPRSERFAGQAAVDLGRLNRLLTVDPVSRLAELEPGLRGPEAEARLREHGFTIGHHPQSFQYGTLGGFAATRSSGQASTGYGRFDELVLALRVATPIGTLRPGRAPRSAAGPDLRQLFLGSEGTLGVITALTLQVRPRPEAKVYEGWRFDGFEVGTAALRRIAQDGPQPTVLRLSDEFESALDLANPQGLSAPTSESAGCLAIVGYEGGATEVAAKRAAIHGLFTAAGARADADAGTAWERDRYRAPYLRDALLDAGALVETVETATFWSGLPGLYTGVRSALTKALSERGTPPVVLCHVSHVYAAGASLYFTVACAQDEDPVEQWRLAKRAAGDAIVAAGASITHHHGVGGDHLPWMDAEMGLGSRLLAAVKATVDPRGILNPGILLPASDN